MLPDALNGQPMAFPVASSFRPGEKHSIWATAIPSVLITAQLYHLSTDLRHAEHREPATHCAAFHGRLIGMDTGDLLTPSRHPQSPVILHTPGQCSPQSLYTTSYRITEQLNWPDYLRHQYSSRWGF